MIGREIQPERGRGMKSSDRFQLERADLDGEDVVFRFFERDFRKRFADVAAGDRLLPAIV